MRLEVTQAPADELHEILLAALQVELAALDDRHVEQIVDHPEHFVARAMDGLEKFALLRRLERHLEHQLREPAHRGERIAQVVCGDAEIAVLFGVHRRELLVELPGRIFSQPVKKQVRPRIITQVLRLVISASFQVENKIGYFDEVISKPWPDLESIIYFPDFIVATRRQAIHIPPFREVVIEFRGSIHPIRRRDSVRAPVCKIVFHNVTESVFGVGDFGVGRVILMLLLTIAQVHPQLDVRHPMFQGRRFGARGHGSRRNGLCHLVCSWFAAGCLRHKGRNGLRRQGNGHFLAAADLGEWDDNFLRPKIAQGDLICVLGNDRSRNPVPVFEKNHRGLGAQPFAGH